MNPTLSQRIQSFFTKEQLTRKRVWMPVLGAIIIGGYFFFRTPAVTKNEYTTVVRKTFTDSVQGSGTVSTQKQVSLTALSSGQVTAVLVTPGQRVKKGQVVARIDARDQSIALQQARNELASAKLSLASSTTDAALIKKQQNTTVKNSYRSLLNAGIAVTKVGDYQGTDGPTVSGSYTCDKEGSYLLTSYSSTGGISIRTTGLENASVFISDIPRPLGSCGLFLAIPKGTTVTANGTWEIQIPNKQSSAYTEALNNYESAQQSAEKAITDAQQSVDTNTIAVQKAVTSLQSAQYTLDKTAVIAPFDGQIGTVPAQVGQQISSGGAVATLVTDGKVADITLNEVDIAQVVVGQKVALTFDAVDGLTLQGTVGEIDTVGSTTQNVVTFKVRVLFTEDDPRVKSGMTVTATITTKEKENAIVVPSGVVKKNSRGAYVEVKDMAQAKDVTVKIPVTIGDTTDTETEITEGLNGGEQVLVRTVTTTASTAAASGSKNAGTRTGSGGAGGNGSGGRSGGSPFGSFGGGRR